MKKFFFDTANIPFIKETWTSIEPMVSKDLVVGITTNPNAFFKLNLLSMNEWFDLLPRLCETVSELRQDDKGVVYIQGPSSQMTGEETLRYAETVSKLSDGNTRVGLKIPPFADILRYVEQINQFTPTNVTGIADAGTALKCITYPVRYVSIIPGRMEEAGIDAKTQIEFVNQCNFGPTEIIAGSMRTVEGLKWTFQYNTVPTIGERVWTQLLEGNNLSELLATDYTVDRPTTHFCPPITQTNYDLSKAFFEQMDKCGEVAYQELQK